MVWQQRSHTFLSAKTKTGHARSGSDAELLEEGGIYLPATVAAVLSGTNTARRHEKYL